MHKIMFCCFPALYWADNGRRNFWLLGWRLFALGPLRPEPNDKMEINMDLRITFRTSFVYLSSYIYYFPVLSVKREFEQTLRLRNCVERGFTVSSYFKFYSFGFLQTILIRKFSRVFAL